MKYFKNLFNAFFGVVAVEEVEVTVEKMVNVPVVCDCAQKLTALVNDEADLRLEINQLEKSKKKAVEELCNLKLQHKITVEDIKHMQKLLDEENVLKLDRAVFEAEKTAEAEIKGIRKEYAKKLETDLSKQMTKMDETYGKILEALPNVNVQLGKTPDKE